jgi:hypothetical protein
VDVLSLLQKGLEAGLDEVVVVGEGFCDTLRFHEDEARAIGKSVAFVGVLTQVGGGTVKSVVIGRQADVSAAGIEKIEHAEGDMVAPANNGEVDGFNDDVIRKDEATARFERVFDDANGGGMEMIAAIQGSVKAAGIEEDVIFYHRGADLLCGLCICRRGRPWQRWKDSKQGRLGEWGLDDSGRG